MVKFFLTSNVAMQALENKYLRESLQFKLSRYSFKKVILPNILIFLYQEISNKLINSRFITLITDIWTNKSMVDYLALGASIVNLDFEKELIVIGMIKMPGSHNAENIKSAIETIINEIKFNKAKISAVVTDEGSNLLRLFKQIDASYYIDLPQDDDIEEKSSEEEDQDDVDEEDEEEDDEEEDDEEEDDEEEDDEEEDDEEEIDDALGDGKQGDFNENESDDSDDENMVENEVYEKFIKNTISESIDEEQEQEKSGSINPKPRNFFDEEEVLAESFKNQIDFIRSCRVNSISVQNDLGDERAEYEFKNNDELISCLELEIGSFRIPRFSCSCHKGNLAIRKAIKASDYFSKLLQSLSKQASSIKKSIVLSSRHRKSKSKIQREQFTRRGSSFMMLFSYLKSFK